MSSCKIRFMDNQKIESSNYTVTNQNSSYPFSNAIGSIRSKLFKATSNSAWRLVVDLGFPDKINTLILFAALGDAIGITSEATIKLEADNVADWASPEYTETLSLTDENSLVHFTSSDALYYRYWSLYIDDPANPDIINFAYIYMGDYTTTTYRNIAPGFQWSTVDPSTTQTSLNGTLYFDRKTKFDRFSGVKFSLVNDADRQILEDLYNRFGETSFMPIAIDPGNYSISQLSKSTKLARFSSEVNKTHVAFDRFDISFSLEEII